MIWHAPLDLAFLAAAALALDLLLGGPKWLGRLPPWDRLWRPLVSASALLPPFVAIVLGLAIDLYILSHWQAWPLLMLLLARGFDQAGFWASVRQMPVRLSHMAKGDAHRAVRMALAEAVTRFNDVVITGSLCLILFGFTGFLTAHAVGHSDRSQGENALANAQGPLSLLGMLGALPAAGLLIVAGLLRGLGRTLMAGGKSLAAPWLPARLLPLKALARLLQIQFRCGGKWIGPAQARARASVGDLQIGLGLLMSATLLWLACLLALAFWLLPGV